MLDATRSGTVPGAVGAHRLRRAPSRLRPPSSCHQARATCRPRGGSRFSPSAQLRRRGRRSAVHGTRCPPHPAGAEVARAWRSTAPCGTPRGPPAPAAGSSGRCSPGRGRALGMFTGMPWPLVVAKSVPWSRLKPRRKYWLALPSPECWVTITPGTNSSTSPGRSAGSAWPAARARMRALPRPRPSVPYRVVVVAAGDFHRIQRSRRRRQGRDLLGGRLSMPSCAEQAD
jgi:hypothetical protein